MGQEHVDEAMMGVPAKESLEEHNDRALSQGANAEWVKRMAGGKNGVVGIIKSSRPGPLLPFGLIWMPMTA